MRGSATLLVALALLGAGCLSAADEPPRPPPSSATPAPSSPALLGPIEEARPLALPVEPEAPPLDATPIAATPPPRTPPPTRAPATVTPSPSVPPQEEAAEEPPVEKEPEGLTLDALASTPVPVSAPAGLPLLG